MSPRNSHPARAVVRSDEASRSEVLFSFASVLLVSALICAMSISAMRLPL